MVVTHRYRKAEHNHNGWEPAHAGSFCYKSNTTVRAMYGEGADGRAAISGYAKLECKVTAALEICEARQ